MDELPLCRATFADPFFDIRGQLCAIVDLGENGAVEVQSGDLSSVLYPEDLEALTPFAEEMLAVARERFEKRAWRARKADAPPRYNGGTRCDMDVGPCACGAWHE